MYTFSFEGHIVNVYKFSGPHFILHAGEAHLIPILVSQLTVQWRMYAPHSFQPPHSKRLQKNKLLFTTARKKGTQSQMHYKSTFLQIILVLKIPFSRFTW